jgi:hypothetical protein
MFKTTEENETLRDEYTSFQKPSFHQDSQLNAFYIFFNSYIQQPWFRSFVQRLP